MVLIKKKDKKEEKYDEESLVDVEHEGIKNEKREDKGIAS